VFLSNQVNKVTPENYIYVHSFGENNMGKRKMEKSGRCRMLLKHDKEEFITYTDAME
jgi:hypothetical protein